MIPKKQLELWLRNYILVVTDRGRATRLIAKHITPTSRMGSEVFSTDVPEQFNDDWLYAIIEEIDSITQADANGVASGGTQSYILQIYHQDNNKSTAQFKIKQDSDVDETLSTSSEPPTKTGIVTQLMRHNEAQARSLNVAIQVTLQTMQKDASRRDEMIEALYKEKFEYLSLLGDLLTRKQEREIEALHATQKIEQREKVLNKVLQLAPPIINRLVGGGKNLLPEKATPLSEQLGILVDSVSPEQLEGLQKVFTQEQMINFIDIVSNLKKNEQKTEEEISKEQQQ